MPIFAGHFERLLRRYANQGVHALAAKGHAIGDSPTRLIDGAWSRRPELQVVLT